MKMLLAWSILLCTNVDCSSNGNSLLVCSNVMVTPTPWKTFHIKLAYQSKSTPNYHHPLQPLQRQRICYVTTSSPLQRQWHTVTNPLPPYWNTTWLHYIPYHHNCTNAAAPPHPIAHGRLRLPWAWWLVRTFNFVVSIVLWSLSHFCCIQMCIVRCCSRAWNHSNSASIMGC